jgi:predicted dehydrogenase
MRNFTQTEPCRWGIIGPGKIAAKFAAAIPLAGDAVLYAVASRDARRARDFAEMHGAAKWYNSYEELAADPAVDCIYIAAPHAFHAEYALMCLGHKKPVLCEKPMALNRPQVQAMVAAARLNNTFLMEAMWSRFLPVIGKTLELVRDGSIGTLKYVRADFGFPAVFDPKSRLFDLRLGGGSLLDIGVYPLFLCLLLLGPPDNIIAAGTLAPTGADDSCQAILQYNNGATALATCNLTCRTVAMAEIGGSEGSITIPEAWYKTNTLTMLRPNEDPRIYTFAPVINGFEYQIREVMACLQQGLIESPLMSHDFSLLLSGVMDGIRRELGVRYTGED